MRQDMTQIADRIRFLDDNGFPNVSKVMFPATQVPSAGANDLDDYEEGNWTPSVGGSATYTVQLGRYIKIGRLVFVDATLTINAIGTGSATTISGLPYASANTRAAPGSIGFFGALATNVLFFGIYVNANASTLTFVAMTAAGVSATVSPSVLGSSTDITFTACYEASALRCANLTESRSRCRSRRRHGVRSR
jgi:hypothetical protein